MAMVLDVGSGGFCNHKCYSGRGCGSVLCARVANCAEQFLLDSDVTDDNVCSVGECETLGKLAGETIGRSKFVCTEAG